MKHRILYYLLEKMGTGKKSKMIDLNIHVKELTQKPVNWGPKNKCAACFFLNPIT